MHWACIGHALGGIRSARLHAKRPLRLRWKPIGMTTRMLRPKGVMYANWARLWAGREEGVRAVNVREEGVRAGVKVLGPG